jgi:putative transposase
VLPVLVYNHFLAERIKRYKASGKAYLFTEMCRDLTKLKQQPDFAWLNAADANALQCSLRYLDDAYRQFYQRVKRGGTAPGFPKFHSKRESRQSYKCNKGNRIRFAENSVKLPLLGWVKCRISKRIWGRILHVNVVLSASGKYSISVCCTDLEPQALPKTGAVAGISLGINNIVTTSDGLTFENPKYLEQSSRKLSRLQRELSRKTKDSANFEKARIKLARAYETVANQKSDYLHKLTTKLVTDYDVISVRDEPVAEMLGSRKMSRQLKDASWGGIIRQLDYKCDWYGKAFVKIDAGFPSSQLCSSCGCKNDTVRKRGNWSEWDCPKCGAHHDRAVNAANNILKEGTRLLAV